MIQFTPRPFKENVNVSKISLKREFFVLTLGLIAILGACYILLGVTLNVLIERIPSKVDHIVGKLFQLKKFETPEKFQLVKQDTQQLLDDLVALLPSTSTIYTIDIIEMDDVNAFAVPGGRVIIFSGLLAEVESENELAMILSHELGHYVHRDHLRALGRGIVFLIITSTFFGTDSGLTDFVGGALSTVDLKFSRIQEEAADLFALDLLNKKYGHTAGATDFFQRIEEKRELPQFLKFLLTHPLGAQRVDTLNSTILSLNYNGGVKRPVSAVLQEQFSKEE